MTKEQGRFRQSTSYLKSMGAIKSYDDLAGLLDVSEERIKSLSKSPKPELTSKEILRLKSLFPQVNWDWVNTGEGEMLSEDEIMYDLESDYPNRESLLRNILAGNTSLPVERQRDILKEEYLMLQQKVEQALEVNNKGTLEILKDIVKWKS